MYLKFYSLYRTSECKEVIYFKLTKENHEQIKFLFNNSIDTKISSVDNKIYLIYSQDNITLPKFKINSEFKYINYKLDDFFNIINLKNNYFFKNRNCKYINLEKVQDIYNNLKIDNPKWDKHIHINEIEKYVNFNNELIKFIDNDTNPSNEVKAFCLYKNIKVNKLESFETNLVDDWNNISHVNVLNNFNRLKKYITDIINNIDDDADYNNFLDYNICKYVNNTNHLSKYFIEENTLENVYYYKKQFYNSKGEIMEVPFIDNDMEYRIYKDKKGFNDRSNKIEDLSKAITIEDNNIFYLDYIYGFYNFGEFWDCITRLLYTKNISDYQLFHLKKYRVYYINYYFNKLNLDFPNKNSNLIIANEYNNNVLFFKKIHFTNIFNICRGHFDNHCAYKFNKIYNDTMVSDKSYILYLKRGSYGRELKNEDILINKLSKLDNFKVINGKETLEDMINYWTNAILVIGAHGSLLKNMIYCKKNPIFIELCPLSRRICFLGNARSCNFLYFFITLPNDEKENIILDEGNINNLMQLIDEVM